MSAEQHIDRVFSNAQQLRDAGKVSSVIRGTENFACAGAGVAGQGKVIGTTITFYSAEHVSSGASLELVTQDECTINQCPYVSPRLFFNKCEHPDAETDRCTVNPVTTQNVIDTKLAKWSKKGITVR